MLKQRHGQYGFTMMELLISMVIIAILIAIGAPAFNTWINNGRIRVAADAIQNGLQLARAEAVHRNTLVRFQLTTSTDNTCAITTANSNWVVSQDDPTGACGTAPSETVAPRIIQVHTNAEGSSSTLTIASSETGASTPVYSGQIAFSGLGRVSTASIAAGNAVQINVSSSAGGTPLRVVVSAAGQIRTCDPSLAQATNPRGC